MTVATSPVAPDPAHLAGWTLGARSAGIRVRLPAVQDHGHPAQVVQTQPARPWVSDTLVRFHAATDLRPDHLPERAVHTGPRVHSGRP